MSQQVEQAQLGPSLAAWVSPWLLPFSFSIALDLESWLWQHDWAGISGLVEQSAAKDLQGASYLGCACYAIVRIYVLRLEQLLGFLLVSVSLVSSSSMALASANQSQMSRYAMEGTLKNKVQQNQLAK